MKTSYKRHIIYVIIGELIPVIKEVTETMKQKKVPVILSRLTK